MESNADKLKFKKLNSKAILPSRGSENACGLDIYSIENLIIKSGQRMLVRTGFAVEIPQGFYGRIAPRSGIAVKIGIGVMAGVIDSDYRGEVLCLLINFGNEDFVVHQGERIAQLIVEKVALLTPEWNKDLDKTSRESGGFGSTGL